MKGAASASSRAKRVVGDGRRRGRADVHDAHRQLIRPRQDHGEIHATALVEPRRAARRQRVGRSVQRRRRAVAIGAGTTHRAALRDRGAHDDRRATTASSSSARSAHAAGQEVCRRGTALEIGDRNTIREFCTFNLRHGAGRRRHARRQRQLDHGLRARRARLPGRQPDDPRQQRDARRARAPRRLGHHRRPHGRAPVRAGSAHMPWPDSRAP